MDLETLEGRLQNVLFKAVQEIGFLYVFFSILKPKQIDKLYCEEFMWLFFPQLFFLLPHIPLR